MKDISEKTPIQLGAVIMLLSMGGGLAFFILDIYASSRVNASEIKAHSEDIHGIKRSIQLIEEMRTDVAVIKEKVDRLDRDRAARSR